MRKIVLGAAAPLFLAVAALAQTAGTSPKPAGSTQASGAVPASTPGPPAPAHPLTAAQAHELMALNGTDKIKQHLVDQIEAYMQRAFPPFVPADVRTDVETSLQKMDIETPTVATYQRYMSTEDASKTIEFYKTPAGKSLLETTPVLMSELQKTALKQGQQTFQAAMERHKTEIEAAQKTYEQQHPAPSLGAPPSGASKSGSPGSSTGSGASKSTPSGGGSAPSKPH